MEYYIGLDVHTRTTTGVIVNEKGEFKLRKTFPTSEANLLNFLNQVCGKKSLTLEECHLSQWLYVTLKDQVDDLLVCDPVYISKKPGAKTDTKDALHLAEELRVGHLKGVYHDASKWIELRVLVNNYLGLVEDIVRSKNRLKAVFRAEGVDTNTKRFYTNKENTKKLRNPHAQFVAESLYEQIERLERLKREYREKFKQNTKTYRPIKNLTSVPGIDQVRANVITAIVCMPHRFPSKHKFWGYCMLVRHIQKSGGKIYGNKRAHGRAELRDLFIGAAESALRTDSSLRRYYEVQRAKGITHKDARIGLARKIASVCLSVLKNNQGYLDNFEKRQQERKDIRKRIVKELA